MLSVELDAHREAELSDALLERLVRPVFRRISV